LKQILEMKVLDNLRYTQDHEWITKEGPEIKIGITDFAQSELGDIVFIEVETIGDELNAEDVFGTIEAVKTVSDLFIPIDGTIIEFNDKLSSSPELVNEDPYGEGWIVKIKPKNIADIESLLSADAYKVHIGI